MIGFAVVIVFFLGFVYFFFNLFLFMLFFYVVYFFMNMWSKLFYLKILKGILFSVSLLVLLVVGYVVYLFVFGEYMVKEIFGFMELLVFWNIFMNMLYVLLVFCFYFVFVFVVVFVAVVFLMVGLFKLWLVILKKMDFIFYMFLINVDFVLKLKLYRNNKIFYVVF